MLAGDIKLSTPHSVSYVDLNGDCLSDLFLTQIIDNQVYFSVLLSNGDSDTPYCLVY